MEGLDVAIERANQYADAGADVIFVEAPQSEPELERIAREIPKPQLANMLVGGTPPRSFQRTNWNASASRSSSLPLKASR